MVLLRSSEYGSRSQSFFAFTCNMESLGVSPNVALDRVQLLRSGIVNLRSKFVVVGRFSNLI